MKKFASWLLILVVPTACGFIWAENNEYYFLIFVLGMIFEKLSHLEYFDWQPKSNVIKLRKLNPEWGQSINWDHNEEHRFTKKEILELYEWWENYE